MIHRFEIHSDIGVRYNLTEGLTVPVIVAQQKNPSSRRYSGKSGEARKSERRETFLEAAISVYAEVGYHGATVRKICARAGLTSRYFYESFNDGEELFTACYEQVLQELLSKALAAAQEFPKDRPSQIVAFHRTLFLELKSKPELARVFLTDLASVGPALSRYFDRSIDSIAGQYAEHTPIHHDDYEVRILVRKALVGGLLHLANNWVEEGFVTPIDTLLAATSTLYGLSDAIEISPTE
ncbi:MAG: TetR/AcrR family transcriptional regulator [Pseudomonadota bacterium]